MKKFDLQHQSKLYRTHSFLPFQWRPRFLQWDNVVESQFPLLWNPLPYTFTLKVSNAEENRREQPQWTACVLFERHKRTKTAVKIYSLTCSSLLYSLTLVVIRGEICQLKKKKSKKLKVIQSWAMTAFHYVVLTHICWYLVFGVLLTLYYMSKLQQLLGLFYCNIVLPPCSPCCFSSCQSSHLVWVFKHNSCFVFVIIQRG